MGISTDKLIPGVLPPKEEQMGIDFVQILDTFDPSDLTKEVLDVLARRDPFVTAYGSEAMYYEYEGLTSLVPDIPSQERLRMGRIVMESDRDELISWEGKYRDGIPNAYKNCRRLLIKAIGSKTCAYIVEKEVEALTPEQHQQQKKDYERYEEYTANWWKNKQYEEPEDAWYWKPASISEKIIKVRKGIKNSSGRCFTQRDFAKLIGYSIPKYAAAEKDDDQVEDALLEKLIMICHANPYYLYDEECEAYMGEYGGDIVEKGDAPAVMVGLDVIYKWILEGKPHMTNWDDGVTDEQKSSW